MLFIQEGIISFFLMLTLRFSFTVHVEIVIIMIQGDSGVVEGVVVSASIRVEAKGYVRNVGNRDGLS